jgi:glycosyltransferase involved in cell wall biosynthesis
MEFTVIVCTYKRAANLPICLGQLACQKGVESRDWEVLVVDNNSPDETPEVVAQLAKELPIKVRYTREPEQGLNYARNHGIRASNSTYYSYVDDDILVGEGWLSALFRAFEANDADAVGGRIHLDPSVMLPKWIRPDAGMLGFLGHQDFGDEAFVMDGEVRYPYGGNMAFNRRVVDRIGYFDPRLGRKGEGRKRSELFKGAETDYFHRMARAGGAHIVYEPDAIVYHRVMPFQVRKDYFRTIHFNAGFQRAIYDDTTFPRNLLGVPRFYYAQLARGVGTYLAQLLSSGPDYAFRQQMNLSHMVGTMLGYRRRRQQRP